MNINYYFSKIIQNLSKQVKVNRMKYNRKRKKKEVTMLLLQGKGLGSWCGVGWFPML